MYEKLTKYQIWIIFMRLFVLGVWSFLVSGSFGFFIDMALQFRMWYKEGNMVKDDSENYFLELLFAFGLTLLLGVTIQNHIFVVSEFEIIRESFNVTRNANQSILFFNRVPKLRMKMCKKLSRLLFFQTFKSKIIFFSIKYN